VRYAPTFLQKRRRVPFDKQGRRTPKAVEIKIGKDLPMKPPHCLQGIEGVSMLEFKVAILILVIQVMASIALWLGDASNVVWCLLMTLCTLLELIFLWMWISDE